MQEMPIRLGHLVTMMRAGLRIGVRDARGRSDGKELRCVMCLSVWNTPMDWLVAERGSSQVDQKPSWKAQEEL